MSDVVCGMLAGPLVLSSVIDPLPIEVAPKSAVHGLASSSDTPSSDIDSPVVASLTGRSRLPTPLRALDRLVAILKNTPPSDSKMSSNRSNPATFPMEVRANVCTLLGQVGISASGEQMAKLNEAAKCTLEDLAKTAGQSILGTAAKKSLEGWAKAQTK